MIEKLREFAPEGLESGAGLVIQDDQGRYLFIVAGTREKLPPGQLFYAGIGGHREPGESWTACAQREAMEEIGQEIDIRSASRTWYVAARTAVSMGSTLPHPRPLALYEMIHPEGTPNEGEIYRIVIYLASIDGQPRSIRAEEASGIIALSRQQVIRGVHQLPRLAALLDEGAELVHETHTIDRQSRMYPLGSAEALAYILVEEDKLAAANLRDGT